VERKLAGETEVLWENLLQCRFVHHKSNMKRTVIEPWPTALGSRRLSELWNGLPQLLKNNVIDKWRCKKSDRNRRKYFNHLWQLIPSLRMVRKCRKGLVNFLQSLAWILDSFHRLYFSSWHVMNTKFPFSYLSRTIVFLISSWPHYLLRYILLFTLHKQLNHLSCQCSIFLVTLSIVFAWYVC
jgi:hypothetical protein